MRARDAWLFFRQRQGLYRSALEDPRFHIAPRPKSIREQLDHRRRRCSTYSRMHLPSGEPLIQLEGVGMQTTEESIPSNDVPKPQQINHYMQKPDHGKDRTPRLNEAHIPLPQNWTVDEVLDTVLTAWITLIHRYQRDMFHQFTWGVRDAGKDTTQCIPTPELELSDRMTAKSLTAKVSSVRTKAFAINAGSLLFLNDGTSAEVCMMKKYTQHH
jgi:hypothetical protein